MKSHQAAANKLNNKSDQDKGRELAKLIKSGKTNMQTLPRMNRTQRRAFDKEMRRS